jgi:hypothetical protein
MRRGLLVLSLAASFAALAAASARAQPMETAIPDPAALQGTDRDLALARIKASGATSVHLALVWSGVAPGERPAGFDPTDPFDPAYRWADFDDRLRRVAAHGLRPVVLIIWAPTWAERRGERLQGTNDPDPVQFGHFARAAALRYNGTTPGLPRVRHWQAWAEPNISSVLNPQFVGGRPYSPGLYREMVNRFAAAVHGVNRANVVIAGGLAPFRDGGTTHRHWGPLNFMRDLLCVNRRGQRTCRTRVEFDVWSHHPFTSGDPRHHALHRDDASLGDLPEIRRYLRAAVRAGNVASRGRVRFWVTEFSWDTKPPDPGGVPLRLHRRWVAEALYRMWDAGVSYVAWTQLRDDPIQVSGIQAGLYFRGGTVAADRAKPSLAAFRFPLVAFPERGRIHVWARTPGGRRDRVLVEHQVGRTWRRLGVVATNAHGIFERRFRVSRTTGWVRARGLGSGARAVPFSLARVPDRWFNPFGLPGTFE